MYPCILSVQAPDEAHKVETSWSCIITACISV